MDLLQDWARKSYQILHEEYKQKIFVLFIERKKEKFWTCQKSNVFIQISNDDDWGQTSNWLPENGYNHR